MTLSNYSIKEIETMLHKGEINAQELVDLSLSQIDEVDEEVKAFLTVEAEKAKEKAKQLDEKNAYDGKLAAIPGDRKSTRLNSSHVAISYAVFCLKKKK